MELELAADSDAVAGLGRLKILAANRDGRARSQAVKIVWHDTPEHVLLADGLTLTEQRGVLRLDRIAPGAATWLPAQPVPVVAEAPDPAELPGPLAPLAAFEGRRTTSLHRFGDEAVTLTIEKGILRAVTAERPVARILLSGDAAATWTAAEMIAAAIPAVVPLASLPAEGIALATGQQPLPRHLGPPVLPPAVPCPADALAHILGHLTDVILTHAQAATGLDAAGVNAVHQMRVAVRRARSAVSVFRTAVQPGALDDISAALRALGRQLGPCRDWDVFFEETLPAIGAAFPGDPRLEKLAAAAARRRKAHRAALVAYLHSPGFRRLAIELAWFTASGFWRTLPAAEMDADASVQAFSAAVMQQRWKRLISAGKRMEALDIPGLHGVRLRAKRARYAAEMFVSLYPGKAAQRFINRLSVLQQRLGVLNDGAVAAHLLEELGGDSGRHAYAVGLVRGFMAARAGKMRPRIIDAFDRFRRQPAYWV